MLMDTLHVITCLCLILHQAHGHLKNVATSNPRVQESIVNTHNRLRQQVKPPASDMLKTEWNTEAQRNAYNVARLCSTLHSFPSQRKITRPISAQCGENIYMSSDETDWDSVIQSWYDEKEFFEYGYGKIDKDEMVGHYTQVVWSTSFLIGCAVHYCYDTDYPFLYICHYCPQGNMMGKEHRPYESGRPCSTCRNSCEGKLCKKLPGNKQDLDDVRKKTVG
ncbi:allurin-like [Pelobates fuscus]|uniref:allurin-like n=1 Tax=Pelobates fuscus TaxID=191477 RepID=UPI002FE4E42B